MSDETFSFVVGQLDLERPSHERQSAAAILAKAELGRGQLLVLAQRLPQIGPLEINAVLECFANRAEAEAAAALVEGLREAPSRSALYPGRLAEVLKSCPESIRESASDLLASPDVDVEKQRARLEELLTSLPPGDVARGHEVFRNPKASCTACHAIGYVGGTVGPDLTRIGATRTKRDLLEAIVFPSASFVRSYESVLVMTTDGVVHNGLVRDESPEVLRLATGVDKEERIAKSDIERIQPGRVSIMPAALDQQLTLQQLADLVAFLEAAK